MGIIGTGDISRAPLAVHLEFSDEVRVVGLADIDRAKAEAARIAHGLDGARVYDDAGAMLAGEDLDLVSIATPPGTHCALTVQALEDGAHVIAERSMAPSLEEADRMFESQRRSGRLLSAIVQNRVPDDLAPRKAVFESGGNRQLVEEPESLAAATVRFVQRARHFFEKTASVRSQEGESIIGSTQA